MPLPSEEPLPRAEFPHTAAVAEEMAAYASDHHYELVLDQIMVGIWSAAQHAANPSIDVKTVMIRCVQSSAAAAGRCDMGHATKPTRRPCRIAPTTNR